MSMSEEHVEKMIQEAKLTAPRLSIVDINNTIVKEDYHVFAGRVTVCALTLRNGFVVVGHSAAVSAENFNEEIGRKIARDNARNEIWALEGYLLRQKLADMSENQIASYGDEVTGE